MLPSSLSFLISSLLLSLTYCTITLPFLSFCTITFPFLSNSTITTPIPSLLFLHSSHLFLFPFSFLLSLPYASHSYLCLSPFTSPSLQFFHYSPLFLDLNASLSSFLSLVALPQPLHHHSSPFHYPIPPISGNYITCFFSSLICPHSCSNHSVSPSSLYTVIPPAVLLQVSLLYPALTWSSFQPFIHLICTHFLLSICLHPVF